jgi:hypothetical protein
MARQGGLRQDLVGVLFQGWSVGSSFFWCVTVQVGDGSRALFWSDRWLSGCSILQLAPDIWSVIPPRIRKSRSVRDALSGRRWIWDITFARTVPWSFNTFVFGITCRTSTCLISPTNSSGNGRLTGNSPLVQYTERCFWKNLTSWCWSHLEGAGPQPVSFLWLACASRSLLDFEPVTLAWGAWLRYLCTMCTGGRNLGPLTSRVCP